MIGIALLPASQPRSLLTRVARRRRRRSHKSAPGARHHHLPRREKSDPIADREHPLATLHLSKSAVTVFPTPRQQTRATPKSP